MICNKCHKNSATYHSTVNLNGTITETHLCENCAKHNKLFSFNDFLAPDFMPFNFLDNYEELTCNNCGFTLSDFKSTGFLGCANCYKVFEEIIKENLIKIQPALTHTGKKLGEHENLSNKEQEIKKLELKLKQAVNEENYELASEIKKQIISLREDNSHE